MTNQFPKLLITYFWHFSLFQHLWETISILFHPSYWIPRYNGPLPCYLPVVASSQCHVVWWWGDMYSASPLLILDDHHHMLCSTLALHSSTTHIWHGVTCICTLSLRTKILHMYSGSKRLRFLSFYRSQHSLAPCTTPLPQFLSQFAMFLPFLCWLTQCRYVVSVCVLPYVCTACSATWW